MTDLLTKLFGTRKKSYYLVTTLSGEEFTVSAKEVEPLHSIQDVLSYIGLLTTDIKSIERKKR